MGEVWKAEDTRLHRNVAIKLLPGAMTGDEESRARFLREARNAGQLNHPNIATVHGIELDGETPYIVMELVEGETLTRAIHERRLTERLVAEVGRAIAEALVEAHAKGIIHRDIKPDNVVLSGSRVKVLDFGIAKRYGASAVGLPNENITEAGVVLGTVNYMSPEQATGRALDGRSDIFSLGVILYEALAGQHPFVGRTNIDTLKSIIRGEPADLLGIAPGASPELVAIIARCLRKSPEERFVDAAELARELSRVAARTSTAPSTPAGPTSAKDLSPFQTTERADAIPRHEQTVPMTVEVALQPAVEESADATLPVAAPIAPTRSRSEASPPRRPRSSAAFWAIAAVSLLLLLAVAGGFLAARHFTFKDSSRPAAAAPSTESAGETAGAEILATTTETVDSPAGDTAAEPVTLPRSKPSRGVEAPKPEPPPTPPPRTVAAAAAAEAHVASEPPAEPPGPLPDSAADAYRMAMDELRAGGWHYLDAKGGMTPQASEAAPLLQRALLLDPRHAPTKLRLGLTRLFSGNFDSASKTLLPLQSLRRELHPHERAIAEIAWLASTAAETGEGFEDFDDELASAIEEHGANREFAAFASDAKKLIARQRH